MNPAISAIIPTYRRAQELGSFLFPSLLGQSLRPLEIIVVDDTEDNSVMDVCREWAGRFDEAGIPLRFLRGSAPRSATRARNKGASASTGETLLFLDSDVELSPNYMDGLASLLRNYPGAVGVQGFITNWAKEPLARMFMEQYGWPGSITHSLASAMARNLLGATVPSRNSCRLFEYPVVLERPVECEWLSGSNMAIRRSAFDAKGFEGGMEGYSLGEDLLLSRELRRLGRLYITPDAKCVHHWSRSGDPQRTRLGYKERALLHTLFGLRGDIIYLNRRIVFRAAGYSGYGLEGGTE